MELDRSPDQTIRALAVPVRRKLFELICERPRSVGELAAELPVSRPAVSQHLAVFVETDLVRVTTVGTRHIYSASPDAASALRQWIDEMWNVAFASFDEFAMHQTNKERDTMSNTSKIDPVAKTIEIGLNPAEAFDLFVNKMDLWWPLDSHAVSTDDAVEIQIDGRVGGSIWEVTRHGEEHVWGSIAVYDVGKRIEIRWHPGAPESEATIVDVRFDSIDSGTRVTLIHSGWDARGNGAQKTRDSYESGWNTVLAPFVSMAAE